MRSISFIVSILIFFAAAVARSQDLQVNIEEVKSPLLINTESTSARKAAIIESKREQFQMNELLRMQFDDMFVHRNAEYSFDVFSSVGNNVGFAGTYERFALLRYTPKMHIQPTSAIGIYAHHDLLRVVPIDDINAVAVPVLLQGLLFVAADNAIGTIAKEVTWVSELLIFSLKNILLQALIRPAVKRKNKEQIKWIQDESFYYSFSFRF